MILEASVLIVIEEKYKYRLGKARCDAVMCWVTIRGISVNTLKYIYIYINFFALYNGKA